MTTFNPFRSEREDTMLQTLLHHRQSLMEHVTAKLLPYAKSHPDFAARCAAEVARIQEELAEAERHFGDVPPSDDEAEITLI